MTMTTTAPTISAPNPYVGPFDVVDFLALDMPRPQSIVGNKIVIPGGLTILGAYPKLGKSQLLQQLALCRAYGKDWLGFPTTPGRTLYVNAEIMAHEFQDRSGRMVDDRGEPERGRLMVMNARGHGVYLNQPAGLARMQEEIEKCEPDLLILDPMTWLFWGNEGKPEDVQPFLQNLARLRVAYGVAIILIHHFRKPPSETPRKSGKKYHVPTAHDLAGSGLLYRDGDAIILGNGKPESGGMDLSFDLRHARPPASFQIQRSPDLWWYRPLTRTIPQELAPALKLLVPGPLSYTVWAKSIADMLKVSNSTGRRRIDDAVEAGFAAKLDDGLYHLSDGAREVLDPSALKST
jgi:AAA domain